MKNKENKNQAFTNIAILTSETFLARACVSGRYSSAISVRTRAGVTGV